MHQQVKKLSVTEIAAIKADLRYPNLIHCIQNVWQQIGSDVEQCSMEMDEITTNDMRIESCLDADRMTTMLGKEGEEADAFVSELSTKYGYPAVELFLNKEIQL